jgi:hypothetical protein
MQFWEMRNSREAVENMPLASFNLKHFVWPEASTDQYFLFRRAKRLDSFQGHVDIRWFPKTVDLVFLICGPVGRKKIVDLLCDMAPQDIQRIPAAYRGSLNVCQVINVVTSHDCLIEERRSHVDTKFGKRIVTPPIIDIERTKESKIFRLGEDLGDIIVTDDIRRALLEAKVTGPAFFPVEGIERQSSKRRRRA